MDNKLPIKVKPYKHQIDAYAFLAKQFCQQNMRGAALLAEMGTGKSLMTIAIVGLLWKLKKANRLLVIAPKSILSVWESEFEKFADFDYSLAVPEGDTARKIDTIRNMRSKSMLQVVVVNYESCWRIEKDITKWWTIVKQMDTEKRVNL